MAAAFPLSCWYTIDWASASNGLTSGCATTSKRFARAMSAAKRGSVPARRSIATFTGYFRAYTFMGVMHLLLDPFQKNDRAQEGDQDADGKHDEILGVILRRRAIQVHEPKG